MRSFVNNLHFIVLALVLGACSPGTNNRVASGMPPGKQMEVPPTAIPQPRIQEEDGFRIARGSTRTFDIDIKFDSTDRQMHLKGKIEYFPVNGDKPRTLDLDLIGVLDKQGFIPLKLNNQYTLERGEKIAAKATCLSDAGTCDDLFIDIYVYSDGVVYRHQIESHKQAKDEDKSEKKSDPKDESQEQEQESESEGEGDTAGEPGQYIGSPKEDIETLLQVKPEAPKSEDSQKDDPKKEDPKQNPPKKSGQKKEEPKKEKPKKGDSKPQESNKDEDSLTTELPKVDIVKNLNQAIGFVNAGRLEKGADFFNFETKNKGTGFHIIRPERKRHFATNELLYVVGLMGQFTKQHVRSNARMSIGDLSAEKGGRLGKHKSHQNGLDADVGYFFSNKFFQGYFASAVAVDKPHADWMLEEQWALFKNIVKTQYVDRIFVHRVLKKALCSLAIKKGEIDKGQNQGLAYQTLRRLVSDQEFHHNHFHLRVKCSKAQPRCRELAEPRPGSGCF